MVSRRWRRIALSLCLNLPFGIDGVIGQEYSTPRAKSDTSDDLWFHFMTRPDIQAPKFNVRIYDEKAISSGYWFISPYEDVNRLTRAKPWVGPYIYDGDGDLIWAGTPYFDHFKIWDFRVAEVDGKSMLTGISHHDNAGIILDCNYEFVKSVSWSATWAGSNMHEFNVLQNGSRALVFTKEDDKKVSGKAVGFDGYCTVEAQGIKELDITVDPPRTVFEWDGTDHIGLDETPVYGSDINEKCTHNWGIHHFNSLDKFPGGDYLLSSRHTDTIFRISHSDGSIVWRLGGLQSDFDIPANVKFSRQHHARFLKQNDTHTTISFFDNARGDEDNVSSNDHSRALVVALQEYEKKVELVLEIHHPTHDLQKTRGSNQLLPSGNFFVCWSKRTRLSEHSPDGTLLMHANSKAEIGTYRGYKFPWVGHPKQPPNVYSAAFVAGADRMSTMAYVSWNGATEVVKWKLYETDDEGENMKCVNETTRRGFETDITYEGYARYVAVEALDRSDQTIGRSEVVHTLAPVEDSESRQTGISDFDESWRKSQGINAASNPISAFISGFVACAVIWAVVRFVRKSKDRSSRRPNATEYEPVQQQELEALTREGEREEHMSDEGVDVREKIS